MHIRSIAAAAAAIALATGLTSAAATSVAHVLSGKTPYANYTAPGGEHLDPQQQIYVGD
ncbi:hypothetical protein ACIA8O_18310 [Kitasatospora sp. NPDC051853]|uniref:hypothetical protein n=1 Tax=Kitasatospora sp. NPDC051853 TaxID=3364058 RepID=UPI0037B46963